MAFQFATFFSLIEAVLWIALIVEVGKLILDLLGGLSSSVPQGVKDAGSSWFDSAKDWWNKEPVPKAAPEDKVAVASQKAIEAENAANIFIEAKKKYEEAKNAAIQAQANPALDPAMKQAAVAKAAAAEAAMKSAEKNYQKKLAEAQAAAKRAGANPKDVAAAIAAGESKEKVQATLDEEEKLKREAEDKSKLPAEKGKAGGAAAVAEEEEAEIGGEAQDLAAIQASDRQEQQINNRIRQLNNELQSFENHYLVVQEQINTYENNLRLELEAAAAEKRAVGNTGMRTLQEIERLYAVLKDLSGRGAFAIKELAALTKQSIETNRDNAEWYNLMVKQANKAMVDSQIIRGQVDDHNAQYVGRDLFNQQKDIGRKAERGKENVNKAISLELEATPILETILRHMSDRSEMQRDYRSNMGAGRHENNKKLKQEIDRITVAIRREQERLLQLFAEVEKVQFGNRDIERIIETDIRKSKPVAEMLKGFAMRISAAKNYQRGRVGNN